MGTTNILDLNNRVSDLEKAVSGGDSAQANKKDIATEFSATTAYTAGCFVYYQGKLYQFNTDHAAGAWDSTDVVEANVTDQIVSNKAAIDGLTASDIMMSDGVTSVQDRIDAHTVGTAVDISEYSTSSNLFTCPSDGYMKVIADVEVGNQTSLRFPSGATFVRSEVIIANHSVITTVYVKKGMQFYVTRSESTYSRIDYISLS